MDMRTNAPVVSRAERQARLTSAFAESALATSFALHAVLSTLYRYDLETWAHSNRVGLRALRIGAALGLDTQTLDQLERAAWLHETGRLVVPDPEDYDGEGSERSDSYRGEQVRAVFEMTQVVPFLRPAADLVVASRECFDGTGVPRGLEREAIPLGARILHLADVSDALTSLSLPRALSMESLNLELVRHAGSRFDPDVVAAWLRCSDDAPSALVPWLSSLERRT
jgi:response regulator RpfG family c-di-GMP phosphodiesterase